MTLEAGRSQWDALAAWLAALPADQHDAALSISEIAQLIGKPLAASARTRGFWATARQWRGAATDFTARLDYYTQMVTFTRRTP